MWMGEKRSEAVYVMPDWASKMASLEYNSRNVLGSLKSERKVSASVLGGEPGEVEGVWVEVMNEGTERQTVSPRRRKVGDVHVLRQTHLTK